MRKGKIVIYIILPAVISIIIALIIIRDNQPANTVSVPGSGHQSNQKPAQTQPASSPDTSYIIPDTLYMSVPFTSQAPFGNWVEPYKEACEEASSLMAGEYFSGNEVENLKADYAKQEILKLVEWEQNRFGYHLDIDSGETATVLKEYYGLQTKTLSGFTQDDLKQELSQDRLILLPADGRKLNNPNFRAPGPPYHMLVIKGYDETNFITNDPGTRKGLNYPYSFDTLYSANGNWSHDLKAVNLNDKMVIVAWK